MSQQSRQQLTEKLDPEWRNGFHIITGMSSDKRNRIQIAIKRLNEKEKVSK